MLDAVIDITNTIAITTIINIRSPPSSISKRSRLWHCKNGHLRWKRTMDYELWSPDEQRLWIMNYGHLMNKAHTASHLLVVIIAQQAAQMNQ